MDQRPTASHGSVNRKRLLQRAQQTNTLKLNTAPLKSTSDAGFLPKLSDNVKPPKPYKDQRSNTNPKVNVGLTGFPMYLAQRRKTDPEDGLNAIKEQGYQPKKKRVLEEINTNVPASLPQIDQRFVRKTTSKTQCTSRDYYIPYASPPESPTEMPRPPPTPKPAQRRVRRGVKLPPLPGAANLVAQDAPRGDSPVPTNYPRNMLPRI